MKGCTANGSNELRLFGGELEGEGVLQVLDDDEWDDILVQVGWWSEVWCRLLKCNEM